MAVSLTYLKILGPVTLGIGTVAGAGVYFGTDLFTNNNITIPTVFVSSTTITNAPSSSNYKCKLDGVEKSCVIKTFSQPADHKKQIKISTLNNLDWTSTKASELGQDNKLFKVEIDSQTYDSVMSDSTKNLSVVFDDNTSYVSTLTPIFGIKDKQIITKTQHSVAKVSEFKKDESAVEVQSPITITDGSTKCLLTTGVSANGVSCNIYKFTDDTQTSKTIDQFMFKTAKELSITKNNYYVFKLEDNSKSSVSEYKSDSSAIVSLNTSVNAGDASKEINKLILSDLKPAFIFGTTGKENIYIFDSAPSA